MLLLAAAALGVPSLPRAQPSRGARMGVIIHSGTYVPIVEGLRVGLKEHGVREGRDATLEIVEAKADVRIIEDAARRFEREKCNLIYCAPTTAAVAVKRATKVVPIFFCVGTDPVASGLVESFGKPGGRLTGVHYHTTDLTAKRLELMKDVLPKARRVLTVFNPGHVPAQQSSRLAREAAARLGMELIERHARSAVEIRSAIAALQPGEADAYVQISDAAVSAEYESLIARAKAIRLPMAVNDETIAVRGALMSYGVDMREVGRQSAKLVQRMLAGTPPGDLPVENVARLAFVLNRRTAQEIGVMVPPAMLVRFDRVIE